MNDFNKLRIVCWSTGIFVLVCLGIGLLRSHGHANTDLPHSNFFIKHTVDLILLNGVFFMFALPVLIKPGTITDDPYNDQGKAKISFIGLSLLIPSVLLSFISLVIFNKINSIQFRIVLTILFIYLYFFYKFLSTRTEKKK